MSWLFLTLCAFPVPPRAYEYPRCVPVLISHKMGRHRA